MEDIKIAHERLRSPRLFNVSSSGRFAVSTSAIDAKSHLHAGNDVMHCMA